MSLQLLVLIGGIALLTRDIKSGVTLVSWAAAGVALMIVGRHADMVVIQIACVLPLVLLLVLCAFAISSFLVDKIDALSESIAGKEQR
jgi:hypothetical protein